MRTVGSVPIRPRRLEFEAIEGPNMRRRAIARPIRPNPASAREPGSGTTDVVVMYLPDRIVPGPTRFGAGSKLITTLVGVVEAVTPVSQAVGKISNPMMVDESLNARLLRVIDVTLAEKPLPTERQVKTSPFAPELKSN
jgi:hypothetical protein